MRNSDRFKRWIILVSIILLVLIVGLTFGGRERVSQFENLLGKIFVPVQRLFVMLSDGAEAVVSPIFGIWENAALVEQLSLENESLKQQVVETTLDVTEYAELRMLREVFGFTDLDQQASMLSARVVAKDPGNWFSMFLIDRGSADGVEKNAPVINGSGLIGLVYEVGGDWAKVIAIIDNKSAVGFRILDEDNTFEGILSGGIDGRLTGSLFDPQAQVEIGDLVITSGKGLYPEGLIIGEVASVIVDPDELFIALEVTPHVNFRQLDRVMVLPGKAVE